MILIGDKMSRCELQNWSYCNLCKYMEAGARGLCPKYTFVTISDQIGLQNCV